MHRDQVKKRKPKVIYYAAPAKSRASYFFASFFLTLAVALLAVGLVVADRNSQRLGWGQDVEVFAVTNSGSQIGVTVMGNTFTCKTIDTDAVRIVLSKIRLIEISFEPEPLQFAEIVGKRLALFEQELLSYCNIIPK